MLRFFPGTLRMRITALIVLSASAAFAISGFVMYEAMMSHVERNAAREMGETLSIVDAHLSGVKSTAEISRDARAWNEFLHGREHVAFAIFDTSGKRLLATPGFLDYAPIHDVQKAREPVNLFNPSAALQYRVAVVPIDGHGGKSVRVAVQYDSSDERALVRSNAEIIFLTQTGGVVVAAIAAYGMTMLGLSPLRGLVARAEQMSSGGLGQPLPKLASSGELMELGLAFNGMLVRLDDSFTRLSEFSSNLAHDLRAPLTNLRVAAQVALVKSRAAREYREVIESSIDEYERLSRMIDDTLFLARAERADLSLSISEFDAASQARSVVGFYESLVREADLSIVIRGRGLVRADLLLYQRALSNLLANAIAHSPRGSTIVIECVEEPGAVVVSLSDHGKGIAEAHVKRIFERFYRGEPVRKNDMSYRAGLGLAIVKSIMDLHKGTCGVQSSPGVGSTFWLRFASRDDT
ncbi:heavy metal sensor histidine kinase [Burkholderia sp. Ac-20365]|uniref:heavy metal sensor histidine kinase n=1 Tax=Burkholderia sp. Ac-20365 TaxID=2703897 RepID=UPI001F11DC85|nr:heavy metal sensor histidine kinase [Burkholderia sp. Ac-20365]